MYSRFLQQFIVRHRHFSVAGHYERSKRAFDNAAGIQQQSLIFVPFSRAPREWNSLPIDILSKVTIGQFSKAVKDHLKVNV